MNIINTYKKLIVFIFSISILNAATIPTVAAIFDGSVESSSKNTKISSLYSSKTENNNNLQKTGNKGACDVKKLPGC